MERRSRVRRACRWAWERAAEVGSAVRPGPRAWRGAAVGLAVGIALVVAVVLWFGSMPNGFSAGNFLGLLMMLGLFLAMAVGALVGIHLVRAMPAGYRWAFGLSAVVLAMLFDRAADDHAVLILAAAVIVPFSLLGAGIAVMSRNGLRDTARLQKAIAVAGTLVALGLLGYALWWLLDDGIEAPEYVNAAADSQPWPEHLELPDPSAPGPHAVLTLTYGSGIDPRRPEFGGEVDLVTGTVDGSKLLDGWEGWSGWWRSRYWGGVDEAHLPLQGRVWYPDGDGPFPLVLTVHGNHSMEDFSDPGYGYLGELLARRGFIFVSVDENFLNGSASSLLSGRDGGLEEENDARGWLLLEHLRLWHQWNAEAGHRFAGKVDTGRIGLIGHSRGGEAVGIAAAFNRLPYYPDDASLRFDYGYAIRGVVAIAPVYGQYRPTGVRTPIRDVSYLVLHGANDGDVTSFAGQAQLDRIAFTDGVYRFKSGLWVLGANHGQFNTTWGRKDSGEPWARFLNLAPLMPAAEQQKVAEVYISAFLETTLRDELGYLPLFLDWRAGADWLPDTIYLSQFLDSHTRLIATFDEDIDLTTTTLADGRISSEQLTVWREERVALKSGSKETNAVYLGWSRDDTERADTERGDTDPDAQSGDDPAGEPTIAAAGTGAPSYTIALPPGFGIGLADALVFALADADEDPTPDDDEEAEQQTGQQIGQRAGQQTSQRQSKERQSQSAAGQPGVRSQGVGPNDEAEDGDENPEPVDLTVELVGRQGRVARLPLSRHSLLQPRIEVLVRKGSLLGSRRRGEAVFQTYALPIADFATAAPDLDIAALSAIRLVFDRSAEGVVILDDVGFRTPPGGLHAPIHPLP